MINKISFQIENLGCKDFTRIRWMEWVEEGRGEQHWLFQKSQWLHVQHHVSWTEAVINSHVKLVGE